MKKITFYLFTLFISSSMLINVQTQITKTVDVDIAGAQTWDAFQDASNEVMTVALDGNSGVTDCNDPVLEFTGAGFETNQATVGGSYLSEMRIAITDTGITAGVFLTPAVGEDMPGTGTYSSGGITDYETTTPNPLTFLIANATTGNMRMEFFEGFDDVADAVDGTFTGPSTITIEYRLSCSNTLSVEAPEELASISMYQTQVESFVTFSNPQSIDLQKAEIYDLTGKLIQSIDLSDMSKIRTIDLSKLSSANYIVKINSKKGSITKKNVKK